VVAAATSLLVRVEVASPVSGMTVRELAARLTRHTVAGHGGDPVYVSLDLPPELSDQLSIYDWQVYDLRWTDDGDTFLSTIREQPGAS
jgi:hypothetical protein